MVARGLAAQEYAGKGVTNRTAIIFEVQMGMVDRGADIGWLSQARAAHPCPEALTPSGCTAGATALPPLAPL